jgi:hypothetical protein
MRRCLGEILTGTICAAAGFVAIAELCFHYTPEWLEQLASNCKGHVFVGALLGLPLGALAGIVLFDRIAYRSERLGMALGLSSTIVALVVSWCLVVATMFLMDMFPKVAFSAPVTVACACVTARWVALRFKSVMCRAKVSDNQTG